MKVRFHIPDFAGHLKFNLVFATMLRYFPGFFREGVEIASIYGTFPPSVWNGGRLQGGVSDRKFVRNVLDTFNEMGIPLRFTFTNPVIEKKHLSDKFCNMVMSLGNNGMNGVIVVSPILEEYIRTTYPKYKITSSTCKRITEPDALSAELERDYHIVVVDYDFNNKFDILEKIENKDKCELLVNACCEPGCKRRTEHYRAIGEEQIVYCNHVRKYPDKPFNYVDYCKNDESSTHDCPCMNRQLFDIKGLSTHITPDDIWNKYVPMGFSQFKIEGRSTNILNLIETYLYYMVKPELIDEARYTLFYNLKSNGVIIFNEE